MSRKDEIDYLDDERKKLWAEVVDQRDKLKAAAEQIKELNSLVEDLSTKVERKTSDYEKEARNASAQTTRYKNKAEETTRQIEAASSTVENVVSIAADFISKINTFQSKGNELAVLLQSSQQAHTSLVQTQAKLDALGDELNAALEEAQENLILSEETTGKINEFKASSESLNSKISAIHSQSAKRNQEIIDLHDEIFGYTYTDDATGEDAHEPGKKVELDQAYEQIKKGLGDLDRELIALKKTKSEEYITFSQEKDKEFQEIKEKIRGLLPEAMTAGLSYAYEQKRKSEELEGKAAEKTYWRSILLLLIISCIPVAVSLYSFFRDGKTLDQVIHNLPQMVVAILPLYAPAFWFAISASKRIKLAKRLTEEYAHKEALSKTFEGLSSQISELPESEVSRELRVKLLYNIISVSSDNPGKLISDYNNSDNPLLDVLDKSLSLTNSLEKIAAVPGVNRILKKVEQRRVGDLAKIEESIEDNLPNGRSKKTISTKGETLTS